MTIHIFTHDAPLYHPPNDFSTGSVIVDGFYMGKALGFAGVKLFMSHEYQTKDYVLETTFGAARNSLTDLAQSPPFTTVLGDPDIKHYVLNVFEFSTLQSGSRWVEGAQQTPGLFSDSYAEMYAFVSHLLTTYAGTNKTFVLKNWEGDWESQDQEVLTTDGHINITQQIIRRCVAYYRNRYRAIEAARQAVGQNGVRVLSALECNRVIDALDSPNIPRYLHEMIPRMRGAMDLISYSAYDSIFQLSNEGLGGGSWYSDQATMLSEIDRKLRAAIAALQAAGGVPVMIGEWGLPEAELPVGYDIATIVNHVWDIVVELELPYHIYWTLLDNEGPAKRYWLYDTAGDLTGAGEAFQTLLAA